MPLRGWIVWTLAAMWALAACQSASETSGEAGSAAEKPAEPGSATSADTTAGTTAQLQPESGAEGPSQPVSLAHGDRHVAAFGGAASTATLVLAALRVDEEGASACPDTRQERCHVWYAALSSGPLMRLVESDTPSGVRIDGVERLGDDLAVLWREGVYLGDETRLMLDVVGSGGARTSVDILAGVQARIAGAAMSWTGAELLVCWVGEPAAEAHSSIAPTSLGLSCRQVSAGTPGTPEGKLGPPHQVATGVGREDGPSLAFGGGHGLLSWTRDGVLMGCALATDTWTCVPHPFGPATVLPATIIAGHGGFLVSWQSPGGVVHGQRIEHNGQASGPLLTIEALEIAASGGIATPQGFLLVATPDDASRLVLVEADGGRIHVVRQPADASERFWVAGGGLIGYPGAPGAGGEAKATALMWRPAHTLLGPAKAPPQTPQPQTPQPQTPQAQTPQAQTPQAQTPQPQTPQPQIPQPQIP